MPSPWIVLVAVLAAWTSRLPAQPPRPYATRVLAYEPGRGVDRGFADPARALGVPQGAGGTMQSLDVVTLGESGRLTLGFDQPITNGPGADFIVFENAFFAGLSLLSFGEVVFVEVSTNGKDFARFPTSYVGPDRAIGPYGALPPGSWRGLAGTTPVFANPDISPHIDTRDPARAGGDAFDLEDLRSHWLVKRGTVNLFRITAIRLVDVVDGAHKDAQGRQIRDPAPGSADIEGVSVLHFLLTRSPKNPIASLTLTPSRHVRLTLEDPDGLGDLDPTKIHLSVQGLPLDFFVFAGLCRVAAGSGNGFVLETLVALPVHMPFKLSASVKDRAGLLAGSSVVLH